MRSLALLLCLGSVLSGTVGQSGSSMYGQDVCDPSNYTLTPDMPLPTLPDQFSTIIEGNIVQRNSTFIIAELYDDPGNRGKFETIIPGTEQREVAIYDYDLGEAFLIPDLMQNISCGVQLLTNSTPPRVAPFGITYVNGSVHIATVSSLFLLPPNTTSVYLGMEEVRGIPCNHWQTCHVMENNSYTLDYYFASTSEWQYIFSEEVVPVQITLRGSRIDEDGALIDLYHVYSFIAFHSGPNSVPDSAFMVPTGLPCRGRIAGETLPEPPPFFSMYIETSDQAEAIGNIREFYDTNLFRLDVFFNDVPYSLIHDFTLQVQYIIDRQINNCSVLPLDNTFSYDVITGPNGTAQLRSPTEFFRFGSGYNFSYEGVTTIRGIEADAWISIRDSPFPLSQNTNFTSGTVELFYSRPGWIARSEFSATTDPVPLAINLTGVLVFLNCTNGSCDPEPQMQNFSALYNIFDFSSQEPDFDVFDTSFCSAPDDYIILSLIIPGREEGLELGQLRRSIRIGLTDWAQIPRLQVANIEVLGENGTNIFVTLQILTIPSIAQYPNPRTPQDILESILNNTSPDDQLPFSIQLSQNVSVMPYLLRVNPDCAVVPTTTTTATMTTTTESTTSTTTTMTSTTTTMTGGSSTTSAAVSPSSTTSGEPSNCPSSSSSSSSLSTAAIAGIAILTFVLGIISALVLVGVLVFCRSRRGSLKLNPVSYQRQEDELAGFPE